MRQRTPGRSSAVKGLSAEGQRLFKSLTKAYGIRDEGGRQILLSGVTSLDLARKAETQLAVDGLTVTSRLGETKVHPLAAVARDNRAAWQAALRALNLAVGEAPTVGRPAGS